MVLVPVQLGGGLGGGAAHPAVGGGPWLRAQSDQGEGAESAKVSKNLWLEVDLFIGTSVRRSSGRRSGVAVRAVDCWQ